MTVSVSRGTDLKRLEGRGQKELLPVSLLVFTDHIKTAQSLLATSLPSRCSTYWEVELLAATLVASGPWYRLERSFERYDDPW